MKLFSEKFEVSQTNPSVELNYSVINTSAKNVALLPPEIVGFCQESHYSWHLNILFKDKRKCVFRFDLPYWKDLHKYCKIKPLQKKCNSITLDISTLINSDFDSNYSSGQMTTLSEVFKIKNRDFGKYEVWLEYRDKKPKKKNAVQEVLKSNVIIINYLKEN